MTQLAFVLVVLVSSLLIQTSALPRPFLLPFLNPCHSSPCKNGASCKQDGWSFKCKCAAGFKGRTCNDKAQPCDSYPCKNGATCSNSEQTFTCKCTDKYQGPTCEEKVKCENPLDLLFIVDAVSLDASGFGRIKGFMKDVTSWLDISDTAANVGVISFGSLLATKIKIGLHQYTDSVGLFKAMDSLLPFNFDVGAAIGAALKLANDKVFVGEQTNAARAVILITEQGQYNDFTNQYNEAAKLKQKGVHIFSFAVAPPLGRALFLNQLKKMSTHKPFETTSSDLAGHVGEMSRLLCSITKNPCETMVCENNGRCSYSRSKTWCVCGQKFKGEHCEEQRCIASSCLNGGSCDDSKGTISCTCKTGFGGPRCEQKVNPCDSSPCKNGGVCSSAEDNVTCECAKGFKGDTCEEKVDPCDSSPCKNGGHCSSVNDQFTCECAKGFKGSTCEEKVDPCESSPCKNGGNCKSNEDKFTCKCAEGFEGETCEEKVDPCESSPCKNGGICSSTEDKFTCKCAKGFKGDTCQEKVDPCDSSPCKNGGVCSSTEDKFTCKCAKGFKGDTCQEKVDPCESSPCKNGGVCSTTDDKFTCECAKGFKGDTCEERVVYLVSNKVHPCDRSPCKNNGMCDRLRDDFNCICTDGYKGKTCGEKVNPCEEFICFNDGKCVTSENKTRCECLYGYSGIQCGKKEVCKLCQNRGSCAKENDTSCQCPVGFQGDTCQKPGFAIYFYRRTSTAYVKVDKIPKMRALTVCLRVKTRMTRRFGYFASYVVGDKQIFSFYKNGSRLGVKVNGMKKLSSVVKINNFKCHHLCVTWGSVDGKYAFYKDGEKVTNGTNLAAGAIIAGSGTLSLAHRMPKGKKNYLVRYVGRLYDFNVWNLGLAPTDIFKMSKCNGSVAGNVKSWSDFKIKSGNKYAVVGKKVCPEKC